MVFPGGVRRDVLSRCRGSLTTFPRLQTCDVYVHRGRTPLALIAAGIPGIVGWRLQFADASARRHVRPLEVPQLLSLG